MLSENYAIACLAKITGRSYGAKYLGLYLILQTGRPIGAKETVVILHGIVCLKRLELNGRNGYSQFLNLTRMEKQGGGR